MIMRVLRRQVVPLICYISFARIVAILMAYKKRVILHLLVARTKEHQYMELLNNLILSINITTCNISLPSVLQLNTKLMVQTGDLD